MRERNLMGGERLMLYKARRCIGVHGGTSITRRARLELFGGVYTDRD
jgi:hypothetical protein